MSKDGTFFWNELATNDVEGCKVFYGELIGWRAEAWGGQDGGTYHVFMAGDAPAGGVYAMPSEWGEMAPHWMAYVSVADVDAAAARVEALGGEVREAPRDIPTIGRICIVADPAGARLGLITPETRPEQG